MISHGSKCGLERSVEIKKECGLRNKVLEGENGMRKIYFQKRHNSIEKEREREREKATPMQIRHTKVTKRHKAQHGPR